MVPFNPDLAAISQRFSVAGGFLEAFPFGEGHINDTYLVCLRQSNGEVRKVILQRINHAVFPNPEAVMHNIERVSVHLQQKVRLAGKNPQRHTIRLVQASDGRSFYRTETGDIWRMMDFIEGAQTYQRSRNPQHYYNAAKAFAEFLRALRDLPVGELLVTIPDFHHTPKRFQAFLKAIERDPANRARNVKPEIEFIMAREGEMGVLVDLVDQGAMPERVTHNDTKLDNVMIDNHSGEGICVIDLDTVMPGLVVFDFGDAVRSGANQAAEDATDVSRVTFDLVIFEHLAQGFLDATRDWLMPVEIEHLAFGARLITLEQGMRFLTDFLNGDTYYKTLWPEHNLARTQTQLKLVTEMETNARRMEEIVANFTG
jgi:hypothetical protein